MEELQHKLCDKQLFQDKKLARHDLGREEFLNVVWQFK
jgi:valyl-tRNA synthetase